MTSKIRRPHTSCGIRESQVNSRYTWGSSPSKKFAKTTETLIFQSKEKAEEFQNKYDISEAFSATENTMEGLVTHCNSHVEGILSKNNEQNTQIVMNGKGEGHNTHGYGLKDPHNFYLTTNKKEFNGQHGLPASKSRPKSTKFYPSDKKFLTSLYQDEYSGKNASQESPQRSGTSSGHRKNKPHPPESFMIWKFPSKLPPLGKVDDLNEDVMQKLSKESYKTTYEVDYTLFRGNQMKEELDNFYQTTKSEKPSFTLDSTNRFDFQKPQMHGNLKNNTTRYGCNARRHIPAIGAVPNIAANVPNMFIREKTFYSQEFQDKTRNAKMPERSDLNLKLKKYIDNSERNDKEAVTHLLKKLSDLDDNQGSTRLSDWIGPR